MSENIQGLIADIGGTNARFALIIDNEITNEVILKCDSYKSFDKAIQAYFDQLSTTQNIKKFSFGIACPIKGGEIAMTNHPWKFSLSEIKNKFGFEKITAMNDFEAVAYSVPAMAEDYVHKIGDGVKEENRNMVVLGPGTGLGMATIIALDESGAFKVVPGEGSHGTMAARTQREFDVFNYLQKNKYTHVSAERVCSGKGILNLYDTIRILDNKMNKPALMPEQITDKALKKECEICEEALALMVRFLARVAANICLAVNAYGGVYVAGGIAPQLIDYIKSSDFREEFESKGNFRAYMEAVPTYIITHPYPAFEGLRQDILKD